MIMELEHLPAGARLEARIKNMNKLGESWELWDITPSASTKGRASFCSYE